MEFKDLSEKEKEVINRFVDFINGHRLSVPAMMFIESIRPLRFIGSQAMIFFEHFAEFFGDRFGTRYKTFASAMEKSAGLEYMLDRLDEAETLREQEIRKARDLAKAEKKKIKAEKKKKRKS